MNLNHRRHPSHSPTDKLISNTTRTSDGGGCDNTPRSYGSDSPTNSNSNGKEHTANKPKSNPWLKKPLWAVSDMSTLGDNEEEISANQALRSPGNLSIQSISNQSAMTMSSGVTLHRHLTLFDLISIGVSATIGSGVFVLCGLIAHDYAGPATFISWSIAGVSACASGVCYAELSGKFAAAGSSYAYVYVTMGELPAVVAGACLTLEYVFSASAVARSWGDKVVAYARHVYITNAFIDDDTTTGTATASISWLEKFLDPGYNINPSAFLVSALSVILLLNGVKESQKVTNFFTVFKICLVLFMCVAALSLMQPENFSPLFPAKFGGFVGVMRGSTSSFFGMIGYDEVCCMGGEAINPKKDLPRAVMGTILLVTVLYILAAVALVGMVPYDDISVTSGFPDGFRFRGAEWASQISAIGEIFTLPIVVLVTIMAQPRLQFAMSADGLLPSIFAQMDEMGNLWYGTLFSGTLMVIIATVVPFTYLDDLISAGILIAFSLTDASVILLRCENPKSRPYLLQKLLLAFNCFSLTMGLLLKVGMDELMGKVMTAANVLCLLVIGYSIARFCPKKFSANLEGYFETPMVPYIPLIGQFLNSYLIGQLEKEGLFLLLAYIALTILYYFTYGAKHSYGNNVGWHGSGIEGEGTVAEEEGEPRRSLLKPIISLSLIKNQRDNNDDDDLSFEDDDDLSYN